MRDFRDSDGHSELQDGIRGKTYLNDLKFKAYFYFSRTGEYEFDICSDPPARRILKSFPVEGDSPEVEEKCELLIGRLNDNYPGRPQHIPKKFWPGSL